MAAAVAASLLGTFAPAWAAATVSTSAKNPDRTVAHWSPGRAGPFLDHFNGGALDVATEAPRRRIISLNSWEWGLVDDIKAANPRAIVLLYQDLSSVRSYAGAVPRTATCLDPVRDWRGCADAPYLPTGVGYVEASRDHPEWFLTDGSGRRLEWRSWPGHWQVDVGNPSYQQRWLENVRAELAAHGWDGVIMDNAITRAQSLTTPAPARYDTDVEMQAAVRSMLAAVSPPLREAGYVTFANVSDSRMWPGLWADWLTLLDGASEEHFVSWSSVPGSGFVWDWGTTGWRGMVDQIATAARMGKIAMVKIGGVIPDRAAAIYGLASYLLANDGRSVISHGDGTWEPEFEWRLGRPLGDYRDLGNHVYRRDFARGTVIVNAADSGSVTVDLGGTYVDGAGTSMNQVTLGATRGAILRTP
ncbi:MAG TPA: putative glycoside hydrolase [Acidimicrobiales bacterium]|jgi:hypothetical protein